MVQLKTLLCPNEHLWIIILNLRKHFFGETNTLPLMQLDVTAFVVLLQYLGIQLNTSTEYFLHK